MIETICQAGQPGFLTTGDTNTKNWTDENRAKVTEKLPKTRRFGRFLRQKQAVFREFSSPLFRLPYFVSNRLWVLNYPVQGKNGPKRRMFFIFFNLFFRAVPRTRRQRLAASVRGREGGTVLLLCFTLIVRQARIMICSENRS
jgi:hypothetical protein